MITTEEFKNHIHDVLWLRFEKEYSEDNAINKIWTLEGYILK